MISEKSRSGDDDAPSRKAPYFGMTGIQLNIWVTVACTTAMTLFGEVIFVNSVA